MVTDLRTQLCEAEDAAYEEFRRQIDGLTEDELEEPFLEPDGWSAKDVTFHVGAWLAECGCVLERIRAGTYVEDEFADQEVERLNRDWFALSRTLDVATVRVELAAARARMLQELAMMPEVTPLVAEWIAESGDIHYREHADQLRAWREERGA